MTSRHATHRMIERLVGDAGLTIAEATDLCRKADGVAAVTRKHVAVMLKRLDRQVNAHGGARSNGNRVWFILRDGVVTTVMLRRSTQPETPEAFDVEKVYQVA